MLNTHSKSLAVLIGTCSAMLIANAASAQCQTSTGPDVIVGDNNGISNYTQVGDTDAFSIGTTSCNIGTVNLQWVANSVNHPVIGQHLYRYKLVDGASRMEQIGLSWLKHGFTALTQNLCCTCSGQGGSVLGVGCSDPYTAGRNGEQNTTVGGLGPRFEVNAHSGAFVWPYTFRNTFGNQTGTAITKRLQVKLDDLTPTMNPGALYFSETQYVSPDDAAARNQDNNASIRRVTISGTTSFSAAMTGSTTRQKAAIQQWKTEDGTVLESNLITPEFPNTGNDTTGRGILASRAFHMGGGVWDYEYAVYNMNSHRSFDSLEVPLPKGAVLTNVGFRDVFYHSGDGHGSTTTNPITYDGTDWAASIDTSDIVVDKGIWSMVAATPWENSNAIRWGTTYNFRFRTNHPPKDDFVTIGLYRAGPVGSADFVTGLARVPDYDCNGNNISDAADIDAGTSQDADNNRIPDECENTEPCLGDFAPKGGDQQVNVDDLLVLLGAWGPCSGCQEDIAPKGGDNQVNVDDLLVLLAAWGACSP